MLKILTAAVLMTAVIAGTAPVLAKPPGGGYNALGPNGISANGFAGNASGLIASGVELPVGGIATRE